MPPPNEDPAVDHLAPGLTGRRTDLADGQTVYALTGELDVAGSAALAVRLDRVLEERDGALVLDLGGLPFIDSSGLRVLIDVRRDLDARGRRLVLRNLQTDVERLLRLTALEAWFETDREPPDGG